jgi:hypothetical protein
VFSACCDVGMGSFLGSFASWGFLGGAEIAEMWRGFRLGEGDALDGGAFLGIDERALPWVVLGPVERAATRLGKVAIDQALHASEGVGIALGCKLLGTRGRFSENSVNGPGRRMFLAKSQKKTRRDRGLTRARSAQRVRGDVPLGTTCEAGARTGSR